MGISGTAKQSVKSNERTSQSPGQQQQLNKKLTAQSAENEKKNLFSTIKISLNFFNWIYFPQFEVWKNIKKEIFLNGEQNCSLLVNFHLSM